MLTWQSSHQDESNREISRQDFSWFVESDVGMRFTKHMFYSRHASRITTDQFPKQEPKVQASWGGLGYAPQGNFLDFNTLKTPFLGFWIIHTGYWPVPFSLGEALQISGLFHQGQFPCCKLDMEQDFNLKRFSPLKIYLLWKIWPISIKQSKLVWIHACIPLRYSKWAEQ